MLWKVMETTKLTAFVKAKVTYEWKTCGKEN